MKKIFLLGLMGLSLIACNDSGNKARTSLSDGSTGGCSSDAVASSATGPLFQVDGETITRDSLPAALKESIYKNEFEAFSKNKQIFEEFALRVYLAKKQGKLKDVANPPGLLDLLDIPNPSEKEMKSLFEMSKNRLPPGTKFEGEIRKQITQYLKSQKVGSLFKEQVAKMKSAGAYRSMVSGPVAPELKLNLTGFPVKGNKDSKISVVEVSDYTCGHCQRAHPQVLELLKKYGDKIKFTQVNFALRPNGLSGLYIQGAYCAGKQSDKAFWTYHDAAFVKTNVPHDHGAAGHSHAQKSPEDNLKKVMEVATTSKLKIDDFKKCVGSAEAKKYVQDTANALSENGISGTPVFIINNKKVPTGANGLEEEIKKLL